MYGLPIKTISLNPENFKARSKSDLLRDIPDDDKWIIKYEDTVASTSQMKQKKQKDNRSLLQKLGFKKVKRKETDKQVDKRYYPYVNVHKEKQKENKTKRSAYSAKHSKNKRSATIENTSNKNAMTGGRFTSDDFKAIKNAKSNLGSKSRLHSYFCNLLVDLNDDGPFKKAIKSKKYDKNRNKTLISTKPVTEIDALTLQSEINLLASYIQRKRMQDNNGKKLSKSSKTPSKKNRKKFKSQVKDKSTPYSKNYAVIPISAKQSGKVEKKVFKGRNKPIASNEDLDL